MLNSKGLYSENPRPHLPYPPATPWRPCMSSSLLDLLLLDQGEKSKPT